MNNKNRRARTYTFTCQTWWAFVVWWMVDKVMNKVTYKRTNLEEKVNNKMQICITKRKSHKNVWGLDIMQMEKNEQWIMWWRRVNSVM